MEAMKSELLGGILKGIKMQVPGLPLLALAVALAYVSFSYEAGSTTWLMMRIAVAVSVCLAYVVMFWSMGALPSLSRRAAHDPRKSEAHESKSAGL